MHAYMYLPMYPIYVLHNLDMKTAVKNLAWNVINLIENICALFIYEKCFARVYHIFISAQIPSNKSLI